MGAAEEVLGEVGGVLVVLDAAHHCSRPVDGVAGQPGALGRQRRAHFLMLRAVEPGQLRAGGVVAGRDHDLQVRPRHVGAGGQHPVDPGRDCRTLSGRGGLQADKHASCGDPDRLTVNDENARNVPAGRQCWIVDSPEPQLVVRVRLLGGDGDRSGEGPLVQHPASLVKHLEAVCHELHGQCERGRGHCHRRLADAARRHRGEPDEQVEHLTWGNLVRSVETRIGGARGAGPSRDVDGRGLPPHLVPV